MVLRPYPMARSNLLGRRAALLQIQGHASILTPIQLEINQLTDTFVSDACDWKSLASMTVGSFAYKAGKITTLKFLPGIAAKGVGLGLEVATFRSSEAFLRGQGLGEAFEGRAFLSTSLDFFLLKGAGKVLEGQSFILTHAGQSLTMVAGHQLGASFHLVEREQGTFVQRWVKAERTNIQMMAGMELMHGMIPGLAMRERSLDLAAQSHVLVKEGTRMRSLTAELLPLMPSNSSEKINSLYPGAAITPAEKAALKWLVTEGPTSIDQHGTLDSPYDNNPPCSQAHRQQLRRGMLEAASRIDSPGKGSPDPAQRPLALLLAADRFDFPVEELARDFRVLLVNMNEGALDEIIASLPEPLRPYVSKRVCDISGGGILHLAVKAQELLGEVKKGSLSRLRAQRRFYEACIQENFSMEGLLGEAPSLVVSSMLLHQLYQHLISKFENELGEFPVPKELNLRADTWRTDFAKNIIASHVEDLMGAAQKGSVVYLAYDTVFYIRNPHSPERTRRHEPLHPAPLEEREGVRILKAPPWVYEHTPAPDGLDPLVSIDVQSHRFEPSSIPTLAIQGEEFHNVAPISSLSLLRALESSAILDMIRAHRQKSLEETLFSPELRAELALAGIQANSPLRLQAPAYFGQLAAVFRWLSDHPNSPFQSKPPQKVVGIGLGVHKGSPESRGETVGEEALLALLSLNAERVHYFDLHPRVVAIAQRVKKNGLCSGRIDAVLVQIMLAMRLNPELDVEDLVKDLELLSANLKDRGLLQLNPDKTFRLYIPAPLRSRLHFQQGDVVSTKLPGNTDAFFLVNVLHHIEENLWPFILLRVLKSIRPSGLLVVDDEPEGLANRTFQELRLAPLFSTLNLSKAGIEQVYVYQVPADGLALSPELERVLMLLEEAALRR